VGVTAPRRRFSSPIIGHHGVNIFASVVPPGIFKRRCTMVEVEYPARFFPVLNLCKGKHFFRLAIVKIPCKAIQMFIRVDGLYPHLHIAAVCPRTVARELFLIEGRADEIAFENLLPPGGTCGAQLDVTCSCRVLMRAVGGDCACNDRHIHRYPKQARKRSDGPCGDCF
jgi:hypothetical protein